MYDVRGVYHCVKRDLCTRTQLIVFYIFLLINWFVSLCFHTCCVIRIDKTPQTNEVWLVFEQ